MIYQYKLFMAYSSCIFIEIGFLIKMNTLAEKRLWSSNVFKRYIIVIHFWSLFKRERILTSCAASFKYEIANYGIFYTFVSPDRSGIWCNVLFTSLLLFRHWSKHADKCTVKPQQPGQMCFIVFIFLLITNMDWQAPNLGISFNP